MTSLSLEKAQRLLTLLGAEGVHLHADTLRSCCPVHRGHNPTAFSFHDGLFTCFSDCKKSYSPISLVMAVRNCSYYEAKGFLQHALNYQEIDTPYETRFDPSIAENLAFLYAQRKKRKPSTPSPPTYLHLEGEPILHPRLQQEGFDEDVRKTFQLTFATSGFMQGRTLIPIDDKDGRCMGYAGRLMTPPSTENTPKYLFTKGLRKAETLYNISRAPSSLKPYLIVCEGYKSVWRLHQWGFDNGCAVMGASLSPTQRHLLLTTNRHILLCGDHDDAGEAFCRQAHDALRHFCTVAILPIAHLVHRPTDSLAEARKEDTIAWIRQFEQTLT